jgi:hypothetical protein
VTQTPGLVDHRDGPLRGTAARAARGAFGTLTVAGGAFGTVDRVAGGVFGTVDRAVRGTFGTVVHHVVRGTFGTLNVPLGTLVTWSTVGVG